MRKCLTIAYFFPFPHKSCSFFVRIQLRIMVRTKGETLSFSAKLQSRSHPLLLRDGGKSMHLPSLCNLAVSRDLKRVPSHNSVHCAIVDLEQHQDIYLFMCRSRCPVSKHNSLLTIFPRQHSYSNASAKQLLPLLGHGGALNARCQGRHREQTERV